MKARSLIRGSLPKQWERSVVMAWTWVVILGLWKDSGATEEGKINRI